MSPEISIIPEADVLRETEGSIHTIVSPILRSWNIAGSSGTLRGDVSPAGSKTAAWYQTETMGTREAQYAPLTELGVCDVKPIDGKIPQMVYWESDQLVVLLKQGNACGGKGLTVEPLGQGHIFRTQMRVKGDNKTVLTTYPEKDGEVLLKSRMREIFTSGSVRGLIVTSGLLPQKEVRYESYSTCMGKSLPYSCHLCHSFHSCLRPAHAFVEATFRPDHTAESYKK